MSVCARLWLERSTLERTWAPRDDAVWLGESDEEAAVRSLLIGVSMTTVPTTPSTPFKRRVGFTVVLILATLAVFGLLLAAIDVVLLVFAGILGGVLLSGLTSALTRFTPLPRAAALVLVVAVLLGVVVGLGALVGPALDAQLVHLAEKLPPAARTLLDEIEGSRVGEAVLARLPSMDELLSSEGVAGRIAGVFTSVGGAIAAALFVVVASLFFAAGPDNYVEPALRLVPPQHRTEARHLLDEIGINLRSWLVARFVSMLAVGVLTGLGLWILGIPAAASLGLLAGALSFIPNLGPILSALPGILLGLAESPATALWAAGIYGAVQIIEGNLITPFAEQRAVAIPPALLLTVQLLMGLFTGVLGLLVATPVLVVIVIAVRELYVRRIERQSSAPPHVCRPRALNASTG